MTENRDVELMIWIKMLLSLSIDSCASSQENVQFFALSFFWCLSDLLRNPAIIFGNFSAGIKKKENSVVVIAAFLSVPGKCLSVTVLEESFCLPSVILLEENSFFSLQ